MIYLGFVIVIATISVMRSLRRVRDLQDRRTPLAMPDGWRKPSDAFHDQTWLPLCTSVAVAASRVLNRPLTPKERRAIWRAKTVLLLETVRDEIARSTDPQAVAVLLAQLPQGIDRPDPTGWVSLRG